MRGIGSMNQVRYYFDAKKISGSQANKEKFVKEVFQSLFQNQTTEIFEVIWGNANGLSQSLFGQNININSSQDKQDALDDFKNWTLTLDNKLFEFIKVK